MKQRSVSILLCVSCLLPSITFADESDATEEPALSKIWTGSAELGIVATTGNTENQTVNFGIKAARETDNWRQSAEGKFLRIKEDDTKTADNMLLGLQIDRKLTEKDYLFGSIGYEQDEFAGFDNRADFLVGYGRKLVDEEVWKLNGEIGVGARRTEFIDGEKNNEGILYLGGVFDWKISETASFQEDLSTRIGSDLTSTVSVSSLTVTIKDNLALKVSFEVKNNSEVPVDKEKTDTKTSVSLVANF